MLTDDMPPAASIPHHPDNFKQRDVRPTSTPMAQSYLRSIVTAFTISKFLGRKESEAATALMVQAVI